MQRIKILGFFAFLGFIAGIIVNAAYHEVYPTIMSLYPIILQAEWIMSGLAGSLLTIIVVILWAYLSRPTDTTP